MSESNTERSVLKLCETAAIFLTLYLQLATAFDGLKIVGLIHGDLKPDNIMLVKDQEQSYTLKLIDFGLAFHRSEAVVGSTHQLPYYR